jgi:N-succinyldiaminopimelate aminotransferase
MLSAVMDVALPDAAFYLWAKVPTHVCGGSDTAFARELLAQYNVAVLPGSYLAREAHGFNPGAGRVRMALVAGVDECVEAAQRIVSFIQTQSA